MLSAGHGKAYPFLASAIKHITIWGMSIKWYNRVGMASFILSLCGACVTLTLLAVFGRHSLGDATEEKIKIISIKTSLPAAKVRDEIAKMQVRRELNRVPTYEEFDQFVRGKFVPAFDKRGIEYFNKSEFASCFDFVVRSEVHSTTIIDDPVHKLVGSAIVRQMVCTYTDGFTSVKDHRFDIRFGYCGGGSWKVIAIERLPMIDMEEPRITKEIERSRVTMDVKWLDDVMNRVTK